MPLSFFSLFFDDDDDDDVIHLICEQNNLYAMQKNVQLDLTESELFVVIGGLLLSGYTNYPNKRMYWSKESDAPTILSDSIRCNRFETILRHLHLNDGSDRLAKLRPLLTLLESPFKKHGGIGGNLSIGEKSSNRRNF